MPTSEDTSDYSNDSLKNVLFIVALSFLAFLLFFIFYLCSKRKKETEERSKSDSEKSDSSDKKAIGPNTLLKVLVSRKDKSKKDELRFSEVCGELEHKKRNRLPKLELKEVSSQGTMPIAGLSMTDPVLTIVTSSEIKRGGKSVTESEKKPATDKKEEFKEPVVEVKKEAEKPVLPYKKEEPVVEVKKEEEKPVLPYKKEEPSVEIKKVAEQKPDSLVGMKLKVDSKVTKPKEIVSEQASASETMIKIQVKEVPSKEPSIIKSDPKTKSTFASKVSTVSTPEVEGQSVTSIVSAYKTDIPVLNLKNTGESKKEKSIKRAKFKGNYFTVEVKSEQDKVSTTPPFLKFKQVPKLAPPKFTSAQMNPLILPVQKISSFKINKLDSSKSHYSDPGDTSSLISVAKERVFISTKLLGTGPDYRTVGITEKLADEDRPTSSPLIKKIKSAKLKVKMDQKIKSYTDDEDGFADSVFEEYARRASLKSLTDSSILSVFSESLPNTKIKASKGIKGIKKKA